MKLCFVTVGATTSFNKLIYYVLTDEFCAALKAHGFTHLMVQYGTSSEFLFKQFLESHPEGCAELQGLGVGGFSLKPSLDPYFAMATKNLSKDQDLGLVISHAGTGSVLSAMRASVPLIIVPNPDLADNHQEELADRLQDMGYAHKATPEGVINVLPIADAQGEKRPGTHAWQAENVPNTMTDQLSFLD